MATRVTRRVYVISDLHIGGQPPETNDPNDRGFRIFTHTDQLVTFINTLAGCAAGRPHIELVINGDFIDFLAEADPVPGAWTPLKTGNRANAILQTIAQREAPIFDALSRLLHSGHQLTIVLGNHDIELSFPDVRCRLAQILKLDSQKQIRFIHDGEAYVIGDVIIEHGNTYDSFNINAYDALRQIRSYQTRREPVPDRSWEASAGSQLVATVMNPLKAKYPFVDLLKPEGEAAIPLLIALEPSCLRHLPKLLPVAYAVGKQKVGLGPVPRGIVDRSASYSLHDFSENQPEFAPLNEEACMDALLVRQLGIEGAATFMGSVTRSQQPEAFVRERTASIRGISRGALSYAAGLMEMLLTGNSDDVQTRLPALLKAVRAFQCSDSFDRTSERDGPYRAAAEGLAKRGYKAVIFGHTHFAKQLHISGVTYINTGTWADIIRFPADIITGPEEPALVKLRGFVASVQQRNYAPWLYFSPTYAKLDFNAEETLLSAELQEYGSYSVL